MKVSEGYGVPIMARALGFERIPSRLVPYVFTWGVWDHKECKISVDLACVDGILRGIMMS
jgi:hypothetical protein